jgi:hypothetical protein
MATIDPPDVLVRYAESGHAGSGISRDAASELGGCVVLEVLHPQSAMKKALT